MILSIGHKQFVESSSIVAILNPDSAPARRLRRGAAEAGMLMDATKGRKVRSIIVQNSNHIVLSALGPETIESRFKKLMLGKKNECPRF